MKATYKDHVIEATKGENGLYTATVDGEAVNIKPSKYQRVMIKRAVQWIDEQGRISKILGSKESGMTSEL